MKSKTRNTAKQIQKLTGWSLVKINYYAMSYVIMGLVKSRDEALLQILAEVQ